MRDHHTYDRKYIGGSDIAHLIAVGMNPEEHTCTPIKTVPIAFGEDGTYTAYIVDGECGIPTHYTPVACFAEWLTIYDDDGIAYKCQGKQITIYRAAQRGCIIQIED